MVNIRYIPQRWRGWELTEATLNRDRAVFIYKYVESGIYLVMEQFHRKSYITIFHNDEINGAIETEVCMLENKLRVDADFTADEVEFHEGSAFEAYLYAGLL